MNYKKGNFYLASMKKIILLLFVIPITFAQNQKDQDIAKDIALLKNQNSILFGELKEIRKKQEEFDPTTKKDQSLAKKAFIRFVSDTWSVLIAHLKRWYTGLIVIAIIWYKSGFPFPFRSKIESYF